MISGESFQHTLQRQCRQRLKISGAWRSLSLDSKLLLGGDLVTIPLAVPGEDQQQDPSLLYNLVFELCTRVSTKIKSLAFLSG